jgi:hypothetical protein
MHLPAGARMATQSFLGDLAEGWREFRSRKWLWVIVAQFSLVNGAEHGALNVLGPVQAKEHLGGAGAWGAILACESAGLIVGGLLMLRFRPQRILLVATFGILLMPPTLIALAFPAPTAVIATAAFATGFGIEVFSVLWDTAMQQNIPGEKLSRVYSYDALGSLVLIPVGLALVGPIADWVGEEATLFGAGALTLIATLPVFAVRDVRRLRRR